MSSFPRLFQVLLLWVVGWAGDLVPRAGAGDALPTSVTAARKARWFNVQEYGAVADDQTDNTDAFSRCLQAVIAAGGGRVLVPSGVYRGRIAIPEVSNSKPSWITIEIAGEMEPTPVFGTIGSFPLQQNGTIIKCLASSGAAVISAAPSTNSLYGGFSAVYVILRNLEVRTQDDPPIGGIDLQYAVQCKLEDVFVNTGVYNVQASKPTHGTRGLITPGCNNAAFTALRNVVVTGFHTGIVVNEHTDGENLVVASNVNGMEFLFAHHASHFGRVGAYRNTHHLKVSGKHGFAIEQLNTEQPGPGQTDARNVWQTLVSDLEDPKNLARGDIHYWVVEGNVGAVDRFVRNGGEGVRAQRIGATPSAGEKAASNKSSEAR